MSDPEDVPLLNESESKPPINLNYKDSFSILFQSEPSYFLSILINFSTSVQYYMLVTLIPLYFSDEHRFSDLAAGAMFGGFGVVIGFSSIYLAHNMHEVSYRRGLYLSFVLGSIGFALLLFDNVWLSMLSILVFQAISCSITWPYIEYGIKMYSKPEIRSLSTSIFYLSQYFAGIVTGLAIDSMWSVIDNKELLYFIVAFVGIFLLGLAAVSLYFSRPLLNVEQQSSDFEKIYNTKKFWRYVLLIFILIMLRSSSFGHLDATLPKFMLRMEGDGAHFGVMLAIHSLNMMIGLLVLTSLAYYFEIYNLIVVGAAIGSLGSIFLIFMDSMAGYTLFVLFISTGESIWVPRLLDYTYGVAPEGQEGIFLALCNCPFYFGMIVTGASSGLLLHKFCPSELDTVDCFKVWLYVFFFSVFITLLLIVLKRVIVGPKGETDEKVCCFRQKVDKDAEIED